MEQAVTLGAYAGTVLMPLLHAHADRRTAEIVGGLVNELWAGLPLVHTRSYADETLATGPAEDLRLGLPDLDGAGLPGAVEDLVPDILDMVRTLWRLACWGSPQELAAVTRFRMGEVTAGLDHLYARAQGASPPERPGTFEAVAKECLELVNQERAPGQSRNLTDGDLHQHASAVGEHLVECLEIGAACRLMTMPEVELLRLQVTTALATAGLDIVRDEDFDRAGVALVVVDDIDMSRRHIELHWRCRYALRRACREALAAGDYRSAALRQTGTISAAMSGALLRILRHAGFEARIDPDALQRHVLVTAVRDAARFERFCDS